MFKKFNILLILLLLFISVAAVSASEEADMNLTSDEIDMEEIEVSDVVEEVSADDSEILSTPVTVTSSNYKDNFDDNGNYKGSSSEIILSGSFSEKNFTFNKTVSVKGDSSNKMSNSMLTFLNGAKDSSVSDLKITNNKAKTYGIFLNGVTGCTIQGCFINNTGSSSYPVCLGNGATYNNVLDNTLITYGETYGHGTRSTPTLLVSGSHYNYLANNKLFMDDANGIYLSSYNGGPLSGGDSNYNTIFNNTIQYNVLPTSWSFAIQIMGGSNTIKSNKIIGAYKGISTAGFGNIIVYNQIIGLTGADYNNKNVEIGGECGIAGSYNTIIANNTITNSKIVSTGSGISVIDNCVVENNTLDILYKGMGIQAAGSDVQILNNNIRTDGGVGIYEKDEGENLLVSGNIINSGSGIGILIEKLSSKRMPSYVTIKNNQITTTNEYAIDISGVKEGTGVLENNDVGSAKQKLPSGVFNPDKPVYVYNESNTRTITPSNIRDYIDENGHLTGVDDGDILSFEGNFSNEVLNINKAVKITGNNPVFLNSTFKVTSGGVWIENLTIINKKAQRLNAWGIYVNEAYGVKIINNNISVTDKNAAYAVYVLSSTDVEVSGNTLFSEGQYLTFTLLAYSCEDCIFKGNTINTLGTDEVYGFSPENSIEGNVYYINGSEVCVAGDMICIDGKTYSLNGSCIDGVSYCIDGTDLIVNNVRYTIVNNTVNVNGTNVSVENNNTVCIDGVVYCLDGNEVCVDGVNYCLDGTDLLVNGVRYKLDTNRQVCIDGVTYCLDGNNNIIVANKTYCLDGNEVCIDGVTYCLDGNNLVVNGVPYPLQDNQVCIDGVTYCIDGTNIIVDNMTYCLDGNEVCIDGVTYCLDGDFFYIKGNSYIRTNHIVPEIYRTYGILLLYSSGNIIDGNTVNVTSKLNDTYSNIGNNSSQNSIVGIDIYYNSHRNVVSNNIVTVKGKDNFIYGMGVLGERSQHTASEGQGASYNNFTGNTIFLEGPYSLTGIIIGDESEYTLIEGNKLHLTSLCVINGINLEASQISTIRNNEFVMNADVVYGIEAYNSNNNEIEGNKIIGNGKMVYGIAVSGTKNSIIGNDIFSNGTGEEVSFRDLDSIPRGNAGIYLTGNSTGTIIKNNNITSQKGYAVNAESTNNVVENNYLVSEMGNSTEAISAPSQNTFTDNYMYYFNANLDESFISYLQEGTLTLTGDVEGAVVKFYVSGEFIGQATVIGGVATYKYTPLEFTDRMISAVVSKKDYKTTEYSNYLTVIPGNINVAVNDISVKPGLKATYVVKVTNALGKAVSGLTVNFRYFLKTNKVAFSGKTDKNGVLTITQTLDKAYSTSSSVKVYVEVAESDYYLAGEGVSNINILDLAPVTIKLNSKVGFDGVLATLTDNNGFAVANKDVTVNIAGKSFSLKTNANGEIILPSVSAGSKSVTVSSAKDSTYSSASKNSKVSVVAPISGNKNVNVYFGNTAQYKIRIADKNGNYVGANKVVSVKVNGKTQKLKTDKNGYVTYSVKKVGTYTIVSEYSGYKVSNKITVKPTLVAKDISKKKAKTIKFSVKLLNKNGKILKNKKVVFKIKGKKYTAKTNKKGVATAAIKNLKVGSFSITSSYGGCTVKNTIKIKK